MRLFGSMNKTKASLLLVASLLCTGNCLGQTLAPPTKISHAEPLYYDLVRDLGARKGEKEFNVGFEYGNFKTYNEHVTLVEYEFAPIHHLGVEAEADFSFITKTNPDADLPNSKMKCLRLATQYSFFVSSERKTTLALGYAQSVELADFKDYGRSSFFTNIVYNPFFVSAKRWGENFHTLLYTGPLVEHSLATSNLMAYWQINTSALYTIPHTRHFVGVELNQEVHHATVKTVVRPQVKIKLNPKLALGMVTGIPMDRKNEHISVFLRIIYEP